MRVPCVGVIADVESSDTFRQVKDFVDHQQHAQAVRSLRGFQSQKFQLRVMSLGKVSL